MLWKKTKFLEYMMHIFAKIFALFCETFFRWKSYIWYIIRKLLCPTCRICKKNGQICKDLIFCKIHLSIYKFGLSVCLFVSNKCQNCWTDRAHREGLWMIKISNICLHQNLIVIKFFKILKIRELFLFSFTMYTKRTCLQLI